MYTTVEENNFLIAKLLFTIQWLNDILRNNPRLLMQTIIGSHCGFIRPAKIKLSVSPLYNPGIVVQVAQKLMPGGHDFEIVDTIS